MKKTCSKCREEKSLDCFNKNKMGKHGTASVCKYCKKKYREENKDKVSEQQRRYYDENKNKIRERKKRYYDENKNKIRERKKRYYDENKDKVSERQKRYNNKNKNKIRERKKRYYDENKDKVSEREKRYYQENKDKIRERAKRYYQENKEQHRKRQREYRRANLWVRIRNNISDSIRRQVKKGKENKSTERILGYNTRDLMLHIASQFQEGMSWDNYGEWHIDHIKPVSFYKIESVDDPLLKECWSLENLRPLWAEENISKGDSMLEFQQRTGRLF